MRLLLRVSPEGVGQGALSQVSKFPREPVQGSWGLHVLAWNLGEMLRLEGVGTSLGVLPRSPRSPWGQLRRRGERQGRSQPGRETCKEHHQVSHLNLPVGHACPPVISGKRAARGTARPGGTVGVGEHRGVGGCVVPDSRIHRSSTLVTDLRVSPGELTVARVGGVASCVP